MKVLVAGDYVPQGRIAKLIEDNNYSFLSEIGPLLQRVDLSIVNLEAPVAMQGQKAIEKCGPNLKMTSNGIKALKSVGFDMVTLANNHIMDYGEDGLNETLLHLKDSDIDYVGVGSDLDDASVIKYFTCGNQKLAIINCCEYEFSIATRNSPGANPLNPIKQFAQIKEAKRNADKVLVIVHGGHEMWQLPSPRMVETYRFFIDAGADVVINHHQHCYSGFEEYNAGMIFYGLGNFCFESELRNSIWNEGYCVILNFDSSKFSYEIIPYRQCDEVPAVTLLDKEHFSEELTSLNKVIVNSGELAMKTEQYYMSQASWLRSIFEPYSGRISKKLYSLGLLPKFLKGSKLQVIKNYVNCESHHDKLKTVL